MIIIKLKGGLGNQMFQYAAAKSLAKKNETELLIDAVTGFENDVYKRSFALHNFNIKAPVADPAYIRSLISTHRLARFLQKKIRSVLPIQGFKYVTERFSCFDQKVTELAAYKNIYLEGYFQSEKYFSENAVDLLSEFELCTAPDAITLQYLEQIKKTTSVSLHVRKYDDARYIGFTDMYDSCSISYYEKAIAYIQSKLNEPVFFIFSDDIEWTKKNIKISGSVVEYISHNNAENSQEDLRLMKACKHNIIANSSFSWWGAWLNKNTDKIIIAPKRWLNTDSKKYKDIAPNKWIRL